MAQFNSIKRRKNKYSFFNVKKDKANILVIIAAVVAVIRGICIIALDNIRSIYVSTNIIIGVVLILYAAIHKEETSVLARIAVIVHGSSWIAAALYLFIGIEYNFTYAINTVFLWLSIITLCASCIGKQREDDGTTLKKLSAFVLVFDFLSYFTQISSYEYVESPGAIHFWLPSLIVSVVITAVSVVLLVKNYIPLKDDRLSEKIALGFAVMMACFALMWATASNLNFALDTSEPVASEEIILDKTSTSGKNSSYYFHVEINGEKHKIDVSSSTYREYEVGDTFQILYYEGAFNDPFYTY